MSAAPKIMNGDKKKPHSCKSSAKIAHRDERADPDPRFNLHKVVAIDLNVFEDAFDVLAFCTLAVLEDKTLVYRGKKLHLHSKNEGD